jgi:gluconokinase
MGVSGVGKTTVGFGLARRRGVAFVDADDLHSPQSVAKMSAGIPLDDADRRPWLDRVGEALSAGGGVVVACSALRREYRERLLRAEPLTCFVHLEADLGRVQAQIENRRKHFMPAALLRSQFETLEPLDSDEPGIRVTVDEGSSVLVERIEHLLSVVEHDLPFSGDRPPRR